LGDLRILSGIIWQRRYNTDLRRINSKFFIDVFEKKILQNIYIFTPYNLGVCFL